MSSQDLEAKLAHYLHTLGANEGYGEELWRLYQANAAAVPVEWRTIFDGFAANGMAGPAVNGTAAETSLSPPAAKRAVPAPAAQTGDTVQPLRGAAARLAGNMQASLSVPTATSQRALPMARLEANRRKLNQHLAARQQKLSLTPLLAWALVQAAREFPALQAAYAETADGPARIERAHINLGLAVDVERAAGRSLLVPVVKQAESLNFNQFFQECDRLVRAARGGKLTPDEMSGATLTLTNPGTIGTQASVPRLMAGQAAIIAAGAMGYPPGFEAVPEATLQVLGVSKTMTLTCTYDHRIVQGAESGAFLGRIQALLGGADSFYENIYADLGVADTPAALPPAAMAAAMGAAAGPADRDAVRRQAGVFQLVHMYRVRGHLRAAADPLELRPTPTHPELELEHHGLSPDDLERTFLCPLAGWPPEAECTLREILEVLSATYCGHLALEFMHLQRPEERLWLQRQMEARREAPHRSPQQRLRVLAKLTEAEEFEHLLHARFVGHKRFSLEGGEALIAGLDHLFNLAAGEASEVVLGMSHRGRLNVLVTILGVAMNEIFSKFEDLDPGSVEGSGDVKYHVGAEGEHRGPNGERLAIEMISNPSHLEAVDPVVEGSTRARQDLAGDRLRARILPLLIHGDAAFAGQGVVAETLNLSQLGGYRTGGTLHLVVNNQIGFTTSPTGARSSLYCTDVARTVQAPIFHVNGDDPEAVLRAVELAYAFRQEFNKDVVVDIVCYRRHGHNEADDPSLTAPVLYRKIQEHPSVRRVYQQVLVAAGVVTEEAAENERAALRERLSQAAAAPLAAGENERPPLTPPPPTTAAPEATLKFIGERLCTLPEDFHLHPKLKNFLARRRQALAGEAPVDWSLAEALALGSLAMDSTPVRLSGQDTGRGTFSQRHAVLYDHQHGSAYIPLAQIQSGQQPVEIYDSLLSEEAAVGFEFGYAMTHPSALVIWEAQFGDFVNGAQVMIDQFLAASEKKWGRSCGLCLLLPHGFEGQGPEHSSARIERFLQLSAENNWRVANCTTAAQYFHLLRSQGRRRPQRPLVVFTPKSLLRHPEVGSPLAALAAGSFAPALPDTEVDAAAVTRVLVSSGKIYYELRRARGERTTTALVRLEQLYPFPEAELRAVWERYPRARELRWVQEEPENMGAWSYLAPRLRALVPGKIRATGVSRPASASPATGSLRRHQQEQTALIARAWAD